MNKNKIKLGGPKSAISQVRKRVEAKKGGKINAGLRAYLDKKKKMKKGKK